MAKRHLNIYGQGFLFKTLAFCIFIFVLVGMPMSTWSGMRKISDKEMAEMTAQAGVSLFIFESSASVDITTLEIIEVDPSQDQILLHDVTFRDGTGSPYIFDTPSDNPLTFDIGSNASTNPILRLNLTCFMEPLFIESSNITFCQTDIGSWELSNMVQSPYLVMLQQRADGDSGLNFETSEKIDIGGIKYVYNSSGESLGIDNIHLCGTATGNPEDPGIWGFEGYLQEGDLDTNPGTYDVGTDSSGNTAILINTPATGSLRIEDINFGSDSFGPCAIDGIQAHRLAVTIRP